MQPTPDASTPTFFWRMFYKLNQHIHMLMSFLAIGMWAILYVCFGVFMGDTTAMLIALIVEFTLFIAITYIVMSSEPLFEPRETF